MDIVQHSPQENVASTVEGPTADDVRESLLPRTLDHARIVSPFYAQRLDDLISRQSLTLVDLPLIPLLTKSDLTENYDLICRPLGPPQFVMYTSGTEGKELLVPVSPDEIAAGEKYFSGILPEITEKPLTLSLVRVGHGGQWFSPSVPTIPAHVTFGPEQVISLLRRRYNFPGVENRISVVEGNLLTLRSLTSNLKELGIDGKDFGIKVIMTTGWYLTPSQRNELESFWSATVIDRYGVTEVNGDAKQCLSCGKFHFDPVVIPETVHPVTKAPVLDGVGGMVLTGLWPFNQVAPKIRYELGDVVKVNSRPTCRISDPSFEFLGRHNQSIFLIDGANIRYLLFPTEIADVLDEYPEAVRRSQTGFLNFRSTLTEDTRRPCVTVEIEWLGNHGSAADEVAERLIMRSEFLREALRDQVCSLQVSLRDPDSLEKIHKV
jgi:phenylacetate-coenzyme A ligase PaaK-like adenylate-forming protein